MMTWISENWELFCIFFGLGVNLLGLVYNICRYVRAGGLHRSEGWQDLADLARKYECEAEGMSELDGAGKLNYVLAGLREYSKLMGYRIEEEALIQAVEKDVAFVKDMNAAKSERLE